MTIGVTAKRERLGGRRRWPMLVVSVIKDARPIFVQSGRMGDQRSGMKDLRITERE